jgi:antitoxin (DNA-binding transcriptional repressor) of toxin-antitoxin stability system
MKTYTIYNAKTHLSKLIEQACSGEDVVIAKGKKPAVRLVPMEQVSIARQFGAMRGKAVVSESFFEALPEEELSAWE